MNWSLETDRLLLRPLVASDYDAMYRVWSDPDVMRYIYPGGWPHDEAVSRRAVETLSGQFETLGFGQWAVCRRSDGELVGYCGFKPGAEEGTAEMLYGFVRAVWGQGYASEAVRAALTFGFRRAGFRLVYASTAVDNTASQRVLQRAGMRFDGEKIIDGAQERCYSMAAHDFA